MREKLIKITDQEYDAWFSLKDPDIFIERLEGKYPIVYKLSYSCDEVNHDENCRTIMTLLKDYNV